MSKPDAYGVTCVVTSCNRHDLLDVTLASFFTYNTYPIERIIVVEDGISVPGSLTEKYKLRPIEWISTGERVGQTAAVDYAYSRVPTPYIFHMEDDWEFYESGFIEKSLQILTAQPKCLQVWLRALNDTNGHPYGRRVHQDDNATWHQVIFDYKPVGWYGLSKLRRLISGLGQENWHGFSFNPGLRRLTDYILTGGYGKLANYDFHNPTEAEMAIGQFYRNQGYFSAILCDHGGRGYVRHIGDGRRVLVP